MAQRKNKIEILDSIITKSHLSEVGTWGYWIDDYEDDYYHHDVCDNCGRAYCEDYSHCQTYEYEKNDLNHNDKVIYMSRGFRWSIVEKPRYGSFINMSTIYSKEVLRQKKINYLLGIDKYEIQYRPTIGDIYNEKRGNI